MVYAGVNGFRLNFSHGTYDERDEQIRIIRKYAAERGKSVAIVQDLQGPKIRLGDIKDNHLDIKTGDELILDYACKEHDGGKVLPVQYNLAEKVKVGEPVLLFDGKVEGECIEVCSSTAITIRAENDGFVMSRKGINLPDTDMGGDIITEKDLADIEFGASRDFDYVAMSFIQTADDINKLHQIMVSYGSTAQIIAKIETKKAVESDETLEEIVKATDGIMVARGDLGVEIPYMEVPAVQKKIISECRLLGKRVIIATEMLESMIEKIRPTRAEISDVANAVYDGASAIMLSGESAAGRYPVEAVQTMSEVAEYTEANIHYEKRFRNTEFVTRSNLDAISHAACSMAIDVGAKAIVVSSMSGVTARMVSRWRCPIPLIGLTTSRRTFYKLALSWGVTPLLSDEFESLDVLLYHATQQAAKLLDLKVGDTIVLTGGPVRERGGTNMIKLEAVKSGMVR